MPKIRFTHYLASAATVAALIPFAAQSQADPTRGTWSTTLLPRYLDGSTTVNAYYDTDLDITWLADPSLATTETFGVTGISSPYPVMNWNTAQNWIAAMNKSNYLGYTGWRMPKMLDTSAICVFNVPTTGNETCGFTPPPETSEFAHLYNVTLGNPREYKGNAAAWPGPFGYIQPFYWQSTTYAGDSSQAWTFEFRNGAQLAQYKSGPYGYYDNVWAVHDGDIGATSVPEPSSAILFTLGVFFFALSARRKQPQPAHTLMRRLYCLTHQSLRTKH